MAELTYQWKIDFALILSLLALIITTIRWFLEERNKKKSKILSAYEKVFDDAIYILRYPLKFKKELAIKKQFTDPDPEFEKAVRNFLTSNILTRSFGHVDKYVPNSIDGQTEKLKYLRKVSASAIQFESKILDEQFDLNILDMSPVNYLNNEEINHRFQNIIQAVGKNLSSFSKDVQRYWSNILTIKPDEIKWEYQKCLDVCPEYFKHNPREFSDPYYDLLRSIRDDYRRMIVKKFERLGFKTRSIVDTVFHPIKSYKKYKKSKSLLR